MSSVKKEGVCRYGGVIGFDKTTDALKDYYAMLFPTYYDGEGFAGTLIDALAAGIPVIASDWKYNPELVKQGFTGMLFKTHDVEELTNALVYIYENQRMWNGMRINCIIEAKNFTPEVAVSQLVETLSLS